MPTDGNSTFVRWFKDAEVAARRAKEREPMRAKQRAKRRKKNKMARSSRKKNR